MGEPRPHSYGCPFPGQCHNCCNHGQYPACYNFRPHCPHFPSPPAYNYFCGGYPTCLQPFPVSYIPPSHHMMEIPRYEYDKSVPRELHCCGCPNHQCRLKEDKTVRIEEQEPNVEMKKSEPLSPARQNNFPHPILWIPPGYLMNQVHSRQHVDKASENKQVSQYLNKPSWQQKTVVIEPKEHQCSRAKKSLSQQRPFEIKVEECEGSRHVETPEQCMLTIDKDPNVRNGCFPVDMDGIRQLLESRDQRKTCCQESDNQDRKKTLDVENKDQKRQFPYNIIWVPYDGRESNQVNGQEEINSGEEERSSSIAPVKVASTTFKIVPIKSEHLDNEKKNMRTTMGDHGRGVGTQTTARIGTLKTIPVMQVKESVSRTSKKDDESKEDVIPMKDVKKYEDRESTSKAPIVQSSSPTKKSKLSPICLRVDPPKKKNDNGSSRSPSPPSDKKHPQLVDSNMVPKVRR